MNRFIPVASNRPARALRGLLATVALAALGSTAASASDWTFSITPYAWAADLGVDATIDDRQVVDHEVPFTDLAEDLTLTAQVHAEAQRGAHGLFFDLFDVELSPDAATAALRGGAGSARLESEMGLAILEVGGLYDAGGDHEGFQLLYGARVIRQTADLDATFDFASMPSLERHYEIRDTLVDGMVGVRYLHRFSRRWSTQARVDVSTGGTELTWSANPSIGYSFGENGRYTVTAGYRRMVVDFDTDDSVDVDMTLSGFVAGLRISF